MAAFLVATGIALLVLIVVVGQIMIVATHSLALHLVLWPSHFSVRVRCLKRFLLVVVR